MRYTSKGALHLHTIHSDGTGTIPQIAEDAKKAGLNWIIITDHNNLAGLHNNEEGWYDDVAVIVGEEVSPENSDHYLAFGITEPIPGSLPPEEIIKAVKAQGGLGFIAHPDESKNRRNKYPPLRWTDWNLQGFDGIEIWNYTSDWIDNYDERFSFLHFVQKHRRLKGPTKDLLNWWDSLNNANCKIVPAVGSLDTHAFKVGVLTIFPYQHNLKTITNHIILEKPLSKDFHVAKQQVFNALKHGNNIIVNRIWNKNAEEPYFSVVTDNSETLPGNTAKINSSSKLMIKLPAKGKIRLIHNGDPIYENITNEVEYNRLAPGKYRFEAYLGNKPWMYSNPIMCEQS